MNHITPQQLISRFALLPHPEGGYYRETYRSAGIIAGAFLPGGFTGDRNFSTAIYFLLEQGDFSAFHRIRSDECWHFYTGDPLLVHIIHPDGRLETLELGNDINAGHRFQHVVPADCWFAGEPAPGSRFSFVGCTVSPGFDFADFELANTGHLARLYPEQEQLIKRLCARDNR